MHASRWFLCCALGALSIAPSVAAQSEGKPATAEPRAAFRAGERAFDHNDYVTALERFRAALRESPNDAVRFNIGVCLERLGRFKEAAAEYAAAARSSTLDRARRDRAKSEAQRVRGRLGNLDADTKTGGGELWVDGERACALPCKLELDPRFHELVAKKAGSESAQRIEIKSGETATVRFEIAETARPTPKPRAVPAPAPQPEPTSSNAVRPGTLTWVGGGLAVVGVAGFIGFGLRAKKLESDYDAHPTEDTRSQGVTMQTLTNVSLGVVAVGAALVVVDLFVLSKNRDTKNAGTPGVIRF